MKKNSKSKTEHAPGCTCSFCGLHYKGFAFKGGYVCESCLKDIKYSYSTEPKPKSKRNT